MRVETGEKSRGVTFAVDAVEPAKELLETCKSYEAVKGLAGKEVESCSDYHGEVVKGIYYHALLAAVYKAYSEHRPLILGPDAVWLTIAQGVAQHMAIHAERLRPEFVKHEGKVGLTVDISHFVKGSPENPWAEAFAGWSEQIKAHVGTELHGAMVCDFSTTGVVERAASEIVLMDIFERYFHYHAYAICGLPQVTLEGSVEDWRRVREKVEVLERFELGWWLEHLRPICDEFVNASMGKPNRKHWQRICKLREEYGGDIINGWVAKLFPYLREFVGGPVRRKNPIFENGKGFQTFDAPAGLSKVPFVWKIEVPGRPKVAYAMEAIGGFVGVEQIAETKALRPKVGWAVCEVDGFEALLGQMEREHGRQPGRAKLRNTPKGGEVERPFPFSMPEDLCAFYHRSNGVELFGKGENARFRILPADNLDLMWGGDPSEDVRKYDEFREAHGGHAVWRRLCDLNDGSFLVIDSATTYEPRECPVIWCHPEMIGEEGKCPVVAEGFEDFLTRALESGGKYWWREAGWKSLGDGVERVKARG